VDGDRSTNDTAVLLANGAAGNAAIEAGTPDAAKFMKVVGEITYELSRMIAKDGEGATKLIEVCVKGAKNERDAELAAMAIANSPLVKTAVYGRDANWGRILCAAGYSGAALREDKIAVFINKVKIVSGGLATGKDAQAARAMEADEVNIVVDLGVGTAEARVLTCDLTEKYIKINAEYRT
jgi:glutamate N-acetyltransferase/amino-acid N-acetyltransferase